MRILLTGATGMLGKRLALELETLDASVLFTVSKSERKGIDRHFQCNLLEETELHGVLREVKPELIVNAAALTNLKYCEDNPEEAYALHVRAVQLMTESAGLKSFIHYSTDAVYSGVEGCYSENSMVAPVNVYAKTKLEGEHWVLNSPNINGMVLRTNIIGFDSASRSSLFEWAYNEMSEGHTISGFSNVFFNPLYVGDLARICLELLKDGEIPKGLYNIGSSTVLSKFEFLNMIQKHFGFDAHLLKKSSLEEQINGVKRPLDSSMDVAKFQSQVINLPTFKETASHLFSDFEKQL